MDRTQSLSAARSLLGLARPLRIPITALSCLSVVANLLTLTGSVFMLQVYDRVLTSRSIPTLLALTALTALLYGFFIAIEALRLRIGFRFAGLLSDALAEPLFAANVIENQRLAPTVSPLRDLETLKGFVGGAAPFVLIDLPWVPFYLALIFAFHPVLGWVALGGAGVISALLVINEGQSRSSVKALNDLSGELLGQSEAARQNAEAVLAMGMLGQLTGRWHAIMDNLTRAQEQQADRLALFTSSSKGFRYFLQSAVLAAGAYLAIHGDMTPGLMIAASIITARALAPVEQTIANWRSFVNARQAWRRINDVLGHSREPEITIELPLPQKHLALTNVSTAPTGRHQPLASHVTFALSAGDGLGIIGPSGSGKSSLVRAVVGVWPLLSGHVRLDGSELAHFHRNRIGTAIGYLPQSIELFEGTVAQNICRFALGEVTERVLDAAGKAQVHALIASLPQGYQTQVGLHGSRLSAGQRQRIGLARALYGDPFLIVLDEPNANLDGDGELALTNAIGEARRRGAIVIVVAHRPSAIVAVNKLLFMEAGRQVRFGDKGDVMGALASPRPGPSVEGHGSGARSLAADNAQ